jgi:hypothetical protein
MKAVFILAQALLFLTPAALGLQQNAESMALVSELRAAQ